MTIVCNLMRTCKDSLAKERVRIANVTANDDVLNSFCFLLSPNHARQLENFWRQLVDNNSVFTACGLCTIDRHIITSVSMNNRDIPPHSRV